MPGILSNWKSAANGSPSIQFLGVLATRFVRVCVAESRVNVVFYQRDGGDILILRILHERMLPELHIGEAADE